VTYWVAVYRANLRVAWAMMMQYRFAILIWAVWGFVGPLISLAVWMAAAQARGGPVVSASQSYAASDFAAYFLCYLIFSHVTMSWDAFEFAYRVRTGSLSPQLLRPLHPIHADASYNIGFKVMTSAVVLPAWIVLIVMLRPTAPASGPGLALAVPALALAAVTRYVWQYALAALAFWTTRVDALNQFYFVLDSFLAGRIAPLALMPGWISTLARFTPFWYMGAFPVELALGRLPLDVGLRGIALQAAWLAAGIVVFRLVWTGGVKQYSAVGA
jgi:ABC-2 type transport system permease protein